MKSSPKRSLIVSLAALLGIVSTGFLAGGCASAATTASRNRSDALITTKVRSALAADNEVNSFYIGVTTVNNVVTLAGLVDTKAQRQAVAKDAAAVVGVSSVDYSLIVD